MDQEQLASVIEALIFVSGDPLPIRRLTDLLEKEEEEIEAAIELLSKHLDESGSGMQVMEVAGGYQLRSRPIHSEYVNRFLERKRKQTLSSAALEALAIIAYKQPITRAEVEGIRGVGVDGVLKSVMDKKLVKITGVKEVPGRPNLYGTTKHFLEYFGINTLKDLPPVGDITQTFPAQAGAAETNEPTEQEQPREEEQPSEESAQPENTDSSGENQGAEPVPSPDEAEISATEESKG